jgi:hypothetical protein
MTSPVPFSGSAMKALPASLTALLFPLTAVSLHIPAFNLKFLFPFRENP